MQQRVRYFCALVIACAGEGGPRVVITFSAGARAGPVTGMVYVAISRDNQRTPIDQASPTGAPLFSKYVENLAPGTPVTLTADDRGHPLRSLRDLPAGDYWMQPFVNVYTRFPRADGKTVWLHNDQWEGQNWKRSPGNVFGDPVQVTIDPKSDAPIRLAADKVIPPIQPPADTALVKRINPERHPHEVVGPADVSRRHRAAAEGLRRTSWRPLSRQLHPGPFLARRAGRVRAQRRVRQALARG